MKSKGSIAKVIVVGGGFGGLRAARVLAGRSRVALTVVDRRNHHLFQPLLYQVAMAGLSPAEIASPIRSILAPKSRVEVFLGEALDVDKSRSILTTSFGDLDFDYLVLACGARHSYFGKNEWEEHAPGLKNLEQATEIRRRVLLAFELAEREKDLERKRQYLTFVVVFGTGSSTILFLLLPQIIQFMIEDNMRCSKKNKK